MEDQTLSIIAIGIGVIALVACLGVYTMIPEEETNPVTWEAIDQYNEKITVIQEDIEELEEETKNPNYNYDNILDSLRDDIDDLDEKIDEEVDDDIRDVQRDMDDVIDCLTGNQSQLEGCLNNI